ncbi:cobalt-zinc-cadmium resistance protein CzcA [Nitrosomonas aestuarii]|uniref:Cobalt-zinc-cadmium resistance protein CzcA n=1 Tax=Nitrosomonas aestuarii TaxID=52441 RepID=A0A1I4E511_9PROT|nr:CusA/CzcA family heavy metal efflux RND transporter [Nitrosomonas aestuarii]SFK99697.1 cobalt-zinc-cadmium resistance protein CzcA [Nitrosomonas aestuarii]
MLSSIVQFMLKQRLIVVVISLILCAFGLRATTQLSVDAFPDVTNVQVVVAARAEGRSAEEIERLVTIPVEIAMTGLPGLVEMRSLNKSGLTIITLVFTDDTDVYFARQLVMERFIGVRNRLPVDVDAELGPVSTGLGEIYQYTLDHPDDATRELTVEELTERRTIQDWVVRPMLRSIQGVAEINSLGGYEKQYQVLINPERLRHYDLTLSQVDRALANNNANASGNILELHAEQYLIRSNGLISTLDDIRNIVLKEIDGVPVFVRDVAEVNFGARVRQGALIKGGYTESTGGIVMMLMGGNAKDIVSRVQDKVAEINERNLLPGGLQIVPFYDRSDLVDAALWTVTKVLIEGIILVIIILFVFLGDVRSSLIVVATLVITPLVTFMIMNHQGISANLMSLGGLAIAIGLMVDSTVVVVENVYHRLGYAENTLQAKLKTIREAVVEVGVPVIFGISIIILVFLPLMTLEGMEGKTFSPLAYTIAIALAVSLVVSLTLSPVLCAYGLKGGADHDTPIIAFLKARYRNLLNKALLHEKTTIMTATALLGLSFMLFPLLGKSFIPILKEGALTPVLIRASSISLENSIKIETEAMKQIATVPGVKSVVSRLGRGESPADPAGPHESDPIITLDPESGRTQDEVDADIRKVLSVLPGVSIVISQPIAQRVDEMITGVRSQVAVKIFGDDLEQLRLLSEQLARIMRTIKGARDIRVQPLSGQQSLIVDINRDAIARYGINVADINELIRTVGGKEISTIFENERRFSLIMRLPLEFRDNVDNIRDLLLRTPEKFPGDEGGFVPGGALIPLHSVAEVKVVDGPAQINREFAKRRVVVGANVHERDMGGFVEEIQERVAKEMSLPDGYYFEWGGQFENMERAMATLSVIVPLTIAAIFFLLFMLFNSVKLAALIILVLPFASIGGIMGLFLTGEYLSVPASVGFIALWGIAVLNGVVLISYIRGQRELGVSVGISVMRGCEQRFRPVLMTATVAMLGLVPFLFATGPGSEVQRPLAIVVIGGLITSTLLTLVVLPTLYRWFDEKPSAEADGSQDDHQEKTEAHTHAPEAQEKKDATAQPEESGTATINTAPAKTT